MSDRGFYEQSKGLMAHAEVPVIVSSIWAGKFRRYHGQSKLERLLDVKTNLLNLRDTIYIGIGFLQSLWTIFRFKPDVVFAKGGFVCLPMACAAKVFRVPLVIHDSDARAGLTNRIIARWAQAIATGAPLEHYSYPAAISSYTGVPISSVFRPMSSEEVLHARRMIAVNETKPLLVVTGGGLGATAINKATVKAASKLLDEGYQIYHVTGKKHYNSVKQSMLKHADYHVVPFVYKDMINVLGAADLVVSRASATFLQELAGLKKPVIAIPAKYLGDQQVNAVVFDKAQAIKMLQDDEILTSHTYYDTVSELLADESQRASYAKRLHEFARPNAAKDVATMISSVYETTRGR